MKTDYPETTQDLIRAVDDMLDSMVGGLAPDKDVDFVCLVAAMIRELHTIAPTALSQAMTNALSVMRAAETFYRKHKEGGVR